MQKIKSHIYQGTIPNETVKDGLCYFIKVRDITGRQANFPENGESQPIHVIVTEDYEPPALISAPVDNWATGHPLPLTAKVHDPSGVKWVRLRYRGVNQHQDFRTLEMLQMKNQEHIYRAEIPAEHIRPDWDLMYYFEVMDQCGNGKIYPDIERDAPYTVVHLKRSGVQ